MKQITFITTVLLCNLTACTPKIVVLDRQTILEQEAAGEWPQMDKTLQERVAVPGPASFPKTEITPKKTRLYNVLNGELVKE